VKSYFAIEQLMRDPAWVASLTPAEKVILACTFKYWARPEQQIPRHKFRTCGYDAGRGWGKTHLIADEFNRRVEAGRESKILLIAPSELRVHEVQIRALLETARPWFRPELAKEQLRWPNGVVAELKSAESPDKVRGSNYSSAWLTEIVDWPRSSMLEAWRNIALSTRKGDGQIFWDSTSRRRNEVLELLRSMNDSNPRENIIVGGTTFANATFEAPVLRSMWASVSGVRREEEMFGKSFRQAAGALWKQDRIDELRVVAAPPLVVEHVGIDPGFGVDESNDMTGLHRAGAGADGHVYLLEDRSGRYQAHEWGDIVVSWMSRGGRCTIETNQGGNLNVGTIRSSAKDRGVRVVTIGREDEWPAPEEGVIFAREVHSRESKGTRADGPAAETEAGRVHIVGELPDLELEMTTYVPGERKSPNRLDAAVFAITELAALNVEQTSDPAGDMRAFAAAQAQLSAPGSAAHGRGLGHWSGRMRGL